MFQFHAAMQERNAKPKKADTVNNTSKTLCTFIQRNLHRIVEPGLRYWLPISDNMLQAKAYDT